MFEGFISEENISKTLFFETDNEILTYLEKGTPIQRSMAIESFSLIPKNRQKRIRKSIWNVFVSDENINIRLSALDAYLTVFPDKIVKTIKFVSDMCYKSNDIYWNISVKDKIKKIVFEFIMDNLKEFGKFIKDCIDY